ncbi:MAG: SurA N-terminal domain-containing protein [Halanaerobiaceae bacterium]
MFSTLRNHSKIIVIIVAVAFAATGALMGFGSYLTNGGGNKNQQQQQQNQNIATVNDEDISQREFLNVLQSQASQTADLGSSQLLDFRLNILNSLIEQKLILQEADKMDISGEASETEVEESVDEILDNYDMTEEELVSNIESQGYNMEEFKNDIRNDLKQRDIIEKTRETTYDNIEVTEDEIRDEYEEAKEEGEEDREFNEAQSDIEQNLINQKQEEAFNNWIEDVRSEANITINDPVLDGVNAYNEEQYDVAIEAFNEIIENNESPGAGSYIYLARSYEKEGNEEKAIEIYDQAREEYSEDWDLYVNLGDLYSNMDDNEQAIEQYDKASELVSGNYMGHYQLYMGYSETGAEEKAEEQMQKVQEISMQQMNQGQEGQEQQSEESEEMESELEEEDIEDIEDMEPDTDSEIETERGSSESESN